MNTSTQSQFPVRNIVLGLLFALVFPLETRAASVFAFSNNQGAFSIQANRLDRLTSAEVRINYQVKDQSENAQVNLYPNLNYTISQYSGPGYLTFTLRYIEKVYSRKNPNGEPNPLPRLSGDYKLLAIARIPGDITALSATLCSVDSGCESLQGSVTNPAQKEPDKKDEQVDEGGQSATTATAAAADTTATTSPVGSAADYPSVVQQDRKISPPAVGPASLQPAQRSPGETGTKLSSVSLAGKSTDHSGETEGMSRSLSFTRRESAYERFIALEGERTAVALARVLSGTDHNLTQAPPLQLSDGSSSLRLTVRPHGTGRQSPQFFISGSRCVDVQTGDNGAWILEVIPNRGVMSTSVIVLVDSEAIEYPLTVAPPLDLFDSEAADPGLAGFVSAANELLRLGEVR